MEKAKKKWYKRWWAIVLYVFIVLIIIISNTNDNTAQKVGQTNQGNNDKNIQSVFKIGDIIKRGDVALTVNKVQMDWKSSNSFDTPSNSNNIFVVVSVSLENQGSKEMNLTGFWDFKLEDSQGVQRSEALSGIGLNKLSSGSVTSLAPGGKISGDLIFEVARAASDKMKLHYKPLLSFDDTIVIELQ